MLVVISDLHFEETASYHIDGLDKPIKYNLSGEPFRLIFARVADEAVKNGATKIDLVLAGDIFDINRTMLWFTENPQQTRPYLATNELSQPLEEMVLKILGRIVQEPEVADALETIRAFGQGDILSVDTASNPIPITVHYLPGNHDRLLNATPKLRRLVRHHLGLPESGAPFPHLLLFPDEKVIVRHGHEYDAYNFAADLSKTTPIPPQEQLTEAYQGAPFGDFVTVDVTSRLPLMFRQHHSDEAIVADPLLKTLYARLLEFDDLRPKSAMLDYFLNEGSADASMKVKAWEAIEPIIVAWLDALHDDPFFLDWLDRYDKKWRPDVIDLIQLSLALKPWRWFGIPLRLAEWLASNILEMAVGAPHPQRLAARETAIINNEFQFLIAGHTHHPQVALISDGENAEQYYIDTGTWRKSILTTDNRQHFGHLKTLTYVAVYGPDEDLGDPAVPHKRTSFDFWTGSTQRYGGQE